MKPAPFRHHAPTTVDEAVALLARLAPEEADEAAAEAIPRDAAEEKLEAPLRLNAQRIEAVLAALAASGATSVVDLGCGEGKLLTRLARDRRFTRVVGLDASARALERASDRLKLDIAGGPSRERVQLLERVFGENDRKAAQNRSDLERDDVIAINLMSAPGISHPSRLMPCTLNCGVGCRLTT